jgi:hypothetical protein
MQCNACNNLAYLTFLSTFVFFRCVYDFRFAHSIESPELYLKNATQMTCPDASSLFSSLENFVKGGTMFALYEDFGNIASAWDTTSPDKVAKIQELLKPMGRKQAASTEASMQKDHMKFRFLDAVYQLQKVGIIKVTSNGKSFQKILSAYIYDS